MSLYVVERRLPNAITADLVMVHEAIVFACERLTSRGEPVRCLGSTYLPGPGRLLSLFEAKIGEAVRTGQRERARSVRPPSRPQSRSIPLRVLLRCNLRLRRRGRWSRLGQTTCLRS